MMTRERSAAGAAYIFYSVGKTARDLSSLNLVTYLELWNEIARTCRRYDSITHAVELCWFTDAGVFQTELKTWDHEWMSEELFGVILLLALLTIMLAVMGIILWHVSFTFINKPQAPYMMSVGVFVEASTQLTVECLFALTNRLGYIEQVQTSGKSQTKLHERQLDRP
jgi:hypothetical protein